MDASDPDPDSDPGQAPAQNGDFKWFGEGFDGFPKRLPDDCMEYSVFIIDPKLRGSTQEFERRERLKKIQAKGNSLLKSPLLKDYIWQRECFNLDLVDPKLTKPGTASGDKDAAPKQFFLHGRTNFGDSIADEWLVVWLLLELSRSFPTAWLQVRDPDGEFLLVEAANALPKWLEPELADNRVWLNRGSLRIIPLAREAGVGSGPATPGLPGQISTQQALDFIQNTEKSVLHSPLVEAEAFHRLRDFPSAIDSSQHRSLLSIPRSLCYILHKNPSYISPAIEAFYLRDPIAIKPLATKDTATLLFPPEDFVTVPARFPKVAYAQLHSQEFGVPPAWTAVKPGLARKPVEMGMKLSCGFEMLVRDPQNRDKRAVREIKMLLEDVDEDATLLPTSSQIEAWDMTVDDDKWLDVDFKDFERELSGKGKGAAAAVGPDATEAAYGEGDPATQQNLKNMVSRFERFLNDEDAGPDGARFSDASSSASSSDDDGDDDDGSNGGEPDSDGEDKAASFTDAEFERAMREMMGMPDDVKESTGLYADARKLALEMEDEDEMERDEETEAAEVWKLMTEKHAARAQRPPAEQADKDKDKGKGRGRGEPAPAEGAEGKGKGKAGATATADSDSDGDGLSDDDGLPVEELSSDDDDEDLLGDMDYGLLKNLLESFKGQGGTAGPAGNLMGLMGMRNVPRDGGGE